MAMYAAYGDHVIGAVDFAQPGQDLHALQDAFATVAIEHPLFFLR